MRSKDLRYCWNDLNQQSQDKYRLISGRIGCVIMAVGALVLLSWFFDVEIGKRLFPDFQSMKFNTALCFIGCGVALRHESQAPDAANRDLTIGLIAFSVFLIAALTLLQYASGWQLGIDNLFVMDLATPPEDSPGRMSVATAICFAIIALAWLTTFLPISLPVLIRQVFALTVIIFSGAAVIGYLFGVEQFRLFVLSTMALHTSVLFVLSGVGILFVGPTDGLMSSAASPYVGGRSLRRLLPFIVLTPVVTGWLSLQGVEAGHYAEAFGFALSSLSSVLILGYVGWFSADALNREEERFRSTIDSSPVATIMIDESGIIRVANRAACSLLLFSANHLLGRPVEDLIPDRFHPGHQGYRREYMRHPKQRKMGEGRDLFARRQDGTEFPAEIALNPVQTADGRFVMVAIVDITERIEAEQKILRLNRIHKVLSGINTLIVRVQPRDALCEEATRITVDEGELPAALVVEFDDDSDQFTIPYAHTAEPTLKTRSLSGYEVTAIRECLKDDAIVLRNDLAEHCSNDELTGLVGHGIRAMAALPLTSDDHSLKAVFVLYRYEPFSFDQPEMKLLNEVAGDISFAIANLAKSQKLEYLTHFDGITGLPNRLLLTDRLQQAIYHADSQRSLLSILYLDIDRFKQVNDSLGHTSGDDVLRQVAQRVLACVGAGDTVSRWGGDEFVILLPGQSIGDASRIAGCINSELHALIVLADDQELFVSCSIGIAEYPKTSADMDGLINSARSAMTAIKTHGGNDYQQFVSGTVREGHDGLALETSLRHALGQDQFQLFYQPQINIASRKVVGMEALLRWNHPTLGMIAPDQFIPLAEKTGLIVPIGEWVLREACSAATRMPGIRMAVNLSARQFHQENLIDVIRQILDETKMPPADLELEITESALIYDVESAITTMQDLMNLNVNISLDDFGTGYSSLSYLKRFPIDTLKIDKSFINELATDPDSEVIVKTIIAMAHSLNLKVIAEGVETDQQLAMLLEQGCDEAQGYLFYRPLPYQDAMNALRL